MSDIMEYGFWAYLKKRRQQRLTDLRIDEVSSVDRGAGTGVRVVLKKRNEDAIMAMTTIQKSHLAVRAFEKGECSANDLVEAANILAAEEGLEVHEAMQKKWYRDLINKSIAGHSLETMQRDACGDGADFVRKFMKDERESNRPMNSGQSERRPMAGAEANNGIDLQKNPAGLLKEMAQAVALRDKCSMDKAYTTVFQTEVGRKLYELDQQRTHGVR